MGTIFISAMLVAALFTYLTYFLLVPNNLVAVLPQGTFSPSFAVLLTVLELYAIRWRLGRMSVPNGTDIGVCPIGDTHTAS